MANHRYALLASICFALAAGASLAAPPGTAPATAPAAARPLSKAEVDRFVQPLIDGQWCTGAVVVLVTEKGAQVYGYGRVSGTDARAPRGDTVYEIGSVSKAFTGLLLAQMVREGKVALDDPVQKHLPASVTVPKRNGKVITLEHLATHTSGLPRMPDNFKPKDPANPYADYTVEQMYAFVTGCKPARDPGEKYEYSNLGVGLLGHVLALKAGKSYEDLLVERICRPLGMADTRIALTDGMRERLAPGHDADGEPVSNWDIPTFAGAGAIRSTGDDLAKFIAAQVGLAKPDEAFAAAVATAHAPRSPVGPGMEMGLGWHVHTRSGFPWHNGQTGGYHSYVGVSPRHKCGVALLTNTGTGVVDPVAVSLLRRMTGEAADPPKLPAVATVAPEVLERYVGKYLLGLANVVTVTRDGDRLYAQLAGQPRFRIWPASETEFFWKVVEARVDFVAEADGKVNALVLKQNGRETKARRLPNLPTTLPAEGKS